MRKIILYIASSLDGFIARKNGSIEWLAKYESGIEDYGYSTFLTGIDTLLMGRKTYDQLKGMAKWPYEGLQTYVFSKSAIDDPRVTAVADPVLFTRELKGKSGKDIWLVGGSQAIGLLIVPRLIDELIITVIPLLIGSGIPLFSNITTDIPCSLISATPYPAGIVQLKYKMRG